MKLQRIQKTLSLHHFCKKISASFRQTPQPFMVYRQWDLQQRWGSNWSCTLVHTPILCRCTIFKISKAADVCSTVGNAKESYNKLCQVKALMPVVHTYACSNTPQVWLYWTITCFCQVLKAAGMRCTVRNAKESHNELHQVKHWCLFLTAPHMPSQYWK